MASAIHGLALPEISVDNFEQSWTRFEFVAVANKWDNGRELAILPALLRGKLQDFYITLGDSEKKDLSTLKKSLRDRAGLTKDPLTSAKKFTEKKQDSKESVRDFEVELRKLFAEAYPTMMLTGQAFCWVVLSRVYYLILRSRFCCEVYRQRWKMQ